MQNRRNLVDRAWLPWSARDIQTHLIPLQWRHSGRDCVSGHQPHYCLLNRLFRRRSKKTSKLRVTGLCAWNSPVPVEDVSIWWRHHAFVQRKQPVAVKVLPRGLAEGHIVAMGGGYQANIPLSVMFPVFQIYDKPVTYWMSLSYLAGIWTEFHGVDVY